MSMTLPARLTEVGAPDSIRQRPRSVAAPTAQQHLPALRTSPVVMGGADQRHWLASQGSWLQSAAGNRAVAQLLRSDAGPPGAATADGISVQRCGGADPATCPCHGDGDSAGGPEPG